MLMNSEYFHEDEDCKIFLVYVHIYDIYYYICTLEVSTT